MEIIIIVVIGTAIWVLADSQGRDWSRSKVARSPFGWFAGTLLLWIVFFPVYLAARGNAPKRP